MQAIIPVRAPRNTQQSKGVKVATCTKFVISFSVSLHLKRPRFAVFARRRATCVRISARGTGQPCTQAERRAVRTRQAGTAFGSPVHRGKGANRAREVGGVGGCGVSGHIRAGRRGFAERLTRIVLEIAAVAGVKRHCYAGRGLDEAHSRTKKKQTRVVMSESMHK